MDYEQRGVRRAGPGPLLSGACVLGGTSGADWRWLSRPLSDMSADLLVSLPRYQKYSESLSLK